MSDETTVALNRRARHDFTIDETFEAGIVLTGTEIKSLRAGKANLSDAYARIERGEAWLVGAHIAPFEGGNRYNHEPKRIRKLLLHRSEIDELLGRTKAKGQTIVPLRLYISDARPGQGGARARPRQAAPRPAARHRRPRRPARRRARAGRRAAGPVGSAVTTIPDRLQGRPGHPGRGRARGGRARSGHRRRCGGRPGRHDVRGDDLAAGQPRRPAPADAARAARLPGRQLQPHPAVERPGRRRRLRDHGAGRVPGDVRHQHDVRGDRPARDRDAADDRAGDRADARIAGRAHPGHAPTAPTARSAA